MHKHNICTEVSALISKLKGLDVINPHWHQAATLLLSIGLAHCILKLGKTVHTMWLNNWRLKKIWNGIFLLTSLLLKKIPYKDDFLTLISRYCIFSKFYINCATLELQSIDLKGGKLEQMESLSLDHPLLAAYRGRKKKTEPKPFQKLRNDLICLT